MVSDKQAARDALRERQCGLWLFTGLSISPNSQSDQLNDSLEDSEHPNLHETPSPAYSYP